MRVITKVTSRSINGARHQHEGIEIETDKGKHFVFVPDTNLADRGDFVTCSGSVTEIIDGQFGDREVGADLYIYHEGTSRQAIELDIFGF